MPTDPDDRPRAARIAATLLAALLTACGGGSDRDAYDAAVDRANAKEAEARALGVASPCAQASQCGVLAFAPTGQAGCPQPTYEVHSLVAASAAAASAAAAEQNALARQAQALEPPPGIACPAFVAPAPTPVCTANACGP